ncbi:hypothetical protein [Psychrobacillus sp. FSL H8-0510]|uniref:hypothetical protein n=1 Tax=Psychrobacillus sp. FSL H8-0510 TaxID=2921394 RepID=UPI0030F607E7
MTNSKLVTLTLASASFVVEGNTNEELLENAKKAMAEQLAIGKFPFINYRINESNSLTIDKVLPGMTVESEDGDVGIITAKYKVKIDVTFANNRSVQGSASIFKSCDIPFEQARSKRSDSSIKAEFWTKGNSGYFKNKGEIHKVVIGKLTGGKAKVHVVNSDVYFTIPVEKLSHYIKDELSEVQ